MAKETFDYKVSGFGDNCDELHALVLITDQSEVSHDKQSIDLWEASNGVQLISYIFPFHTPMFIYLRGRADNHQVLEIPLQHLPSALFALEEYKMHTVRGNVE